MELVNLVVATVAVAQQHPQPRVLRSDIAGRLLHLA